MFEETHEAERIDGKAIAQAIRKEVAAGVTELRQKYGKVHTCYFAVLVVMSSTHNPYVLVMITCM